MVRQAHFAQALDKDPALALDSFLLRAIQQEHDACYPRLADLVRRALGRGACAVLLDGLDEVGDNGTDGQSLRKMVVKQVQKFADRWCTAGDRPNRLVVTSRIEGYWDEALHGCDHVELSPLNPPEEVEQVLAALVWRLRAGSQRNAAAGVAEGRAATCVAGLLPQLMDAPGVCRLATNPLLLTIRVLIYENVGKLPNRRAKLYEICTNTLIASWREQQTDRHNKLLDDMGEATITRLVAALAYWLHEKRPGGTAPLAECHDRLLAILTKEENYDRPEALAIADAMLSYASCEAGLLCERGLGQYGFFHLTFEEYLAAYHLTRQAPEARRRCWGRTGKTTAGAKSSCWRPGSWAWSRTSPTMPASSCSICGRWSRVTRRTPAGRRCWRAAPGRHRRARGEPSHPPRRDARAAQTMQDLDPDTDRPNAAAHAPRTRYAAGEAWDELGGLPDDLDAWVQCPECADPSPGQGRFMAAICWSQNIPLPTSNSNVSSRTEAMTIPSGGAASRVPVGWRMKGAYCRGKDPEISRNIGRPRVSVGTAAAIRW